LPWPRSRHEIFAWLKRQQEKEIMNDEEMSTTFNGVWSGSPTTIGNDYPYATDYTGAVSKEENRKEEILEWAGKKMDQEAKLDEMCEKFPALKKAREQFETMKRLVEND
jgi:hypothetical protein